MEEIKEFIPTWLMPVRKNCIPQLYIVGGAVRDSVLNRTISDIDIVCKNAKKAVSIIGKNKNCVVVFLGKKAKAFCYRVVDRHNSNLFVDITEMSGDTILDDLQCRDFTINAMAILLDFNANSYEILDPLKGKQDIKNKIIRVCRPDAFVSDPLRILRAFRFASETGFDIDIETRKLAAKHTALIASVSYERITYELFKILNTKNCAKNIDELGKIGMWKAIFYKELFFEQGKTVVKNDSQIEKNSIEIFKNCENIINNLYLLFYPCHKNIKKILMAENKLQLLKLTTLLYDLGKNYKTECFSFYDDIQKAQTALKIVRLMKLSGKDLSFLKVLMNGRYDVKCFSRSENNTKNLIKFSGKFKDNMVFLIIVEIAEIFAETGLEFCLKNLQKNRKIDWLIKSVKKYFSEVKIKIDQDSLITGKDLIKLGINQGPNMGSLLKKIRELQDLGIITNKDEAIKLAKKQN